VGNPSRPKLRDNVELFSGRIIFGIGNMFA
jgi:hypothetical protein